MVCKFLIVQPGRVFFSLLGTKTAAGKKQTNIENDFQTIFQGRLSGKL